MNFPRGRFFQKKIMAINIEEISKESSDKFVE